VVVRGGSWWFVVVRGGSWWFTHILGTAQPNQYVLPWWYVISGAFLYTFTGYVHFNKEVMAWQ
jgi:hypothetical protein